MARHRVASVADIAADSMRRVYVSTSSEGARSAGGDGGVSICLAHAEDGNFYAIDDTCTHEAFSLSEGELWGMDVECPQHGSRFNLLTGKVTGLPAVVPTRTYPVTVEGEDVYVEVPD